ncbi:MAG TPA: hypothetical protein VKF59_21950 [Candidatus Dormibacteraeota bacterium]|nr:hypothetical protein [Candidatus Dormibacteraeota bacterium]
MTEPGAEIIARGRALRVRRLAASLRAVDDEELQRIHDALQVLDRVTLDVLRGPR